MITRERLEEFEAEALAPYGHRSRDSRGREFPEEEPHYRTAFQRDRDRILHTTAFRRLEYKTQVFVITEGDYYRTRLTHTLEVSQIGRTLARALGGNEDLVEAISLAHDLGHPPFGHSGELTLSRLMADHGGFDHNKQSLRIVTNLERRYPDFSGLNLTWEVREGIVKHETEYDVSDAEGYEPDKRGHLAAQIANVADELAYTAHDLDDGLHSDLISIGQLKGISLWEMTRESIDWTTNELDELTRHRLIRRLIGLEVSALLEATQQRIEGLHSVEALQLLDHNVVGYSDDFVTMNQQMKDFLYANMYQHYRVVRMQTKAERFIEELFNAYVEKPEILPKKVQERIQSGELYRTICDYLAGMTDRFALKEYSRLFDPSTLP
ncbi:MAG: deoxyguanosinetriphosphate triphosphohydrolase [Chloroflexi bacterium]|nr:deoxyguanosinetriphosphate triphosphohydrolase [Chloroflexota bacterium]